MLSYSGNSIAGDMVGIEMKVSDEFTITSLNLPF